MFKQGLYIAAALFPGQVGYDFFKGGEQVHHGLAVARGDAQFFDQAVLALLGNNKGVVPPDHQGLGVLALLFQILQVFVERRFQAAQIFAPGLNFLRAVHLPELRDELFCRDVLQGQGVIIGVAGGNGVEKSGLQGVILEGEMARYVLNPLTGNEVRHCLDCKC